MLLYCAYAATLTPPILGWNGINHFVKSKFKKMKTKILLPVLAVIAALAIVFATSAFGIKKDQLVAKEKSLKEESQTEPKYWQLRDAILDPSLPGSYEPYDGPMPPDCEGNEQVCVIYAPCTGENLPDFSQVGDLENDLITFRDTGVPSNLSGAVDYKP